MAAKLSPQDQADKDLRKSVQKDSPDRLKKELKVGQDFYDSNAIEAMTREELVDAVTKLRQFCNVTVSGRIACCWV